MAHNIEASRCPHDQKHYRNGQDLVVPADDDTNYCIGFQDYWSILMPRMSMIDLAHLTFSYFIPHPVSISHVPPHSIVDILSTLTLYENTLVGSD